MLSRKEGIELLQKLTWMLVDCGHSFWGGTCERIYLQLLSNANFDPKLLDPIGTGKRGRVTLVLHTREEARILLLIRWILRSIKYP